MAKGRKTGGRQAGTPNKATQEVIDKLQGLGCDPVEGMARIAMGDVCCTTCNGSLKARYSRSMHGLYRDPDGGKEGTCLTCMGTGKEPIPMELRGKLFAELTSYIAPKRKAIDHSGELNSTVVRLINRTGDQ